MHDSQALASVSHRFHLTPKPAASKMPRRGKLLHPLLLTLALLCHGESAKVARPVDGTGPSGLTLGLESARTHGPSRQTHGGGSMPWQTQSGLARLPCQEPALRYVQMRSLPNPHALCAGSDGNRRGSQGDSLGTCPAGTADAAAADPPEGPRQQLPPAVLRQRQRNRHQGRRQRRFHDRHQPRSKRKRHLYIFRSGNRTGVRAKRQHQPMVMRTMQKLQGSHPPVQMTLVYVIALVANGGAIGRTSANAGRASSTREKVGNHVLRDS